MNEVVDIIDSHDEESSKHKLLVTYYFKNRSKRFLKHQHIVQGEPFSWGVKIKNIDSKPSPQAKIIDAGVQDLNDKFFHYMAKDEILVRSLNPSEEISIPIEESTLYLDGMLWAYLELEPTEENATFTTYQIDEKTGVVSKYHDSDDDNNKWMCEIYVQKRMELLQSRTNNYILALTIITVWESVFGLKNTLKLIVNALSSSLFYLSKMITWLGNLL
ncbi:hypothetical protein [Photobacterium sanguinicancri]|uniref:Uncharacterized protein n=1 Tax=Photobacterium sanguinicancri TaxID=875932 RepID=A0ABX4FU34_9GAMM|nr:hypothetical protein [Photobacterium sanguinicancri]OZS42378.1 hypothetical protein ASV53_18695 [Photobacterium sanguinicancri]